MSLGEAFFTLFGTIGLIIGFCLFLDFFKKRKNRGKNES